MNKKRTKAGTSRAEAAQRRALFVEAMCDPKIKGNATKAAKAAGYSPKTARQQGARLLSDVSLSKAIAERRAEVVEKAREATDLSAQEVLASLARDIRFDPAKLYNEDGSLKKVHELDEDTRLALRGVEVDQLFVGRGEERQQIGNTVKVKFPEKTSAREQGMKHFGLYERDNEQKPPLALPPGTKTVRLDFSKVKARVRAAGERAGE